MAVLKDAGIAKKDVAEVVLVGGSTRIPKVQSLVSTFFGGKELCKSINPDEAVAYGAAVQGAILSGRGGEATQSLLLLDVTPLSLGIEVTGGRMSVIVKRNTPIPNMATEPFTTVDDYQTEIDIRVFEGERPHTRDCNLLGSFLLSGLPSLPAGEASVKVTFELNSDGVLVVTAKDKANGNTNNIVIENNTGRLSREQVQRMVNEASEYAQEDARARAAGDARAELESLVLQVGASASLLEPVARNELDQCVAAVKQWLLDNPDAAASEITARSKEFLSTVPGIMQRAGATGAQGNAFDLTGMGPTKVAIEDVGSWGLFAFVCGLTSPHSPD